MIKINKIENCLYVVINIKFINVSKKTIFLIGP